MVQRKPLTSQITSLIHRQEVERPEDEEEETLQTKEVTGVAPAISTSAEARINNMRGNGQPLPDFVRAFFEPRFGYDFSQVRMHTDAKAAEAARAVNALAYTVGRDIAFGMGQYAPETNEGRRLLTHELTHVVQQTAAGTPRLQRTEAEDEEKKKLAVAAPPKTPSEAAPAVAGAVPAAPAAAVEATDEAVDALDLTATAKAAAKDLKKKHPDITFTSGRRNVSEQASAMASNIVSGKDRKWIEKTYASAASLQKWVDDNPKAKTVDEIAKGLEETMNGMAESKLSQVSKHLSGEAFDVQPQDKDADAIKTDIKALSGLTKFLDKEGGLVRWHAQFKRISNSPNGIYNAETMEEVVLHSQGQSLDTDTRIFMESRFGHDFSQVRVHTDANAAESARAVKALAYTAGRNVVFGAGQYAPESELGKQLLAHELTHVVQQGGTAPLRRKPEKGTCSERPARLVRNAPQISQNGRGIIRRYWDEKHPCPSSVDSPPADFCLPFPTRAAALAHRATHGVKVLAGAVTAARGSGVAANLYSKFILGGSSQIVDASDGANDFTENDTIQYVTKKMLDDARSYLVITREGVYQSFLSNPQLQIDLPVNATQLAGVNNESTDYALNFCGINLPGVIAGGIGKTQTGPGNRGADTSAAMNDFRSVTGFVRITAELDGPGRVRLTSTPHLHFYVLDTVDFCPGACGSWLAQWLTVPLSRWEASGISGDVTFKLDFPSPVVTFRMTMERRDGVVMIFDESP